MSRPNDRIFYAAVAAISLSTGLVNALSAAQDAAKRGAIYDVRTPLLWEMTSILVIILLAPLLLVAVRTLRRSPAWATRAAIALAVILAFSALHIAGMVILRKLLMWSAGGSYDFQLSLATIVYEFRKDIMTAVLIGGAIWLFDRDGGAMEGPVSSRSQSAAPAPAALWLRDGTSRVRISPAEILWINSAGNYIEYDLADGRQHLIRGTLAAAETDLAGFSIVRIHRGRLANLARVTAVAVRPSGDFDLTFDTGHRVQGSRRYRSAVATLERTSEAR
ncbi:LytTR family transcriptional regulator [Bradyrhizobium ontarionense]|uniref:LytTR family transcriptional regulator n=1 Tax=Bradyrhizobium ontarionense TaxID=2898149 RepID=A0ABY3RET5_9BRAD|nr:LytTR family DNA-binding domain-containing protein [Bradyrhizobium sp. A19]UFZ05517.1 LytTR family transcriptional regulator [Bradyrhizobium sp. A19]